MTDDIIARLEAELLKQWPEFRDQIQYQSSAFSLELGEEEDGRDVVTVTAKVKYELSLSGGKKAGSDAEEHNETTREAT